MSPNEKWNKLKDLIDKHVEHIPNSGHYYNFLDIAFDVFDGELSFEEGEKSIKKKLIELF